MKIWMIAAAVCSLSACSGASDEQVKLAKEECIRFYKEARAASSADVQANDNWMKNGKLVIEIAERESASESSYTSSVCVVDLADGKMNLPSIFEQREWKK